MTGDQLITRLRVGDFLRLAHRAGKVHRAYIDQRTGSMRICRPSMLGKVRRDAEREWFQVDATEYGADPCSECK